MLADVMSVFPSAAVYSESRRTERQDGVADVVKAPSIVGLVRGRLRSSLVVGARVGAGPIVPSDV